MDKPAVSVIIPTCKRPDTVARAIESVLNQTYDNVDVIVVDDNTDGTEGRAATESVMKSFSDNKRVTYLKHHVSKNGSAARNTGARYSNAKYVAFLDDDDEFLPTKIESQVKLLEGLDYSWGCCYSRFCTEHEGRVLEYDESRQGNLYIEVLTRKIMLAGGSNLLVRKSVFDEVGGFDESFVRSQDVEFLVKILRLYKIAYDSNLGLIVHIGNNHSKIDFDASCALYLKSFKKDIEELPKDVKEAFLTDLAKQRFLFHFRTRHDYLSCLKMIKNGEISVTGALSYLFEKTKEHYIKYKQQMKTSDAKGTSN